MQVKRFSESSREFPAVPTEPLATPSTGGIFHGLPALSHRGGA